jgi:hypothetical protein
MTEIIQPWTSQTPESIAITLWEQEDERSKFYNVEIIFFLEEFESELIDEVVSAEDLDATPENYREAIEPAISALSLLYPETFISPIIYVYKSLEEGGETEMAMLDLSDPLVWKDTEKNSRPKMKI